MAAGVPVLARPASPSVGRLPIVSMPDTGTGMNIRGSTHRKAPQAILSLLFSILIFMKPGNPAHSFPIEMPLAKHGRCRFLPTLLSRRGFCFNTLRHQAWTGTEIFLTDAFGWDIMQLSVPGA